MADSLPLSKGSTLSTDGSPNIDNGSEHPPAGVSNADGSPIFYPAPRTTKHTLMGIRALETHAQKGNDPFDYEQKYPDDEAYTEMGPMARFWKVFLDECGKFDTEMVENWRDALDVLLVFAGLFSAVVTTFVSQTSQNLQPNFQEINASKMNEVSELIRAAFLNGTEGVMSIPRSTNTAASFRPSRSALWVNGLWFTSLALSLTTALIAVLTKQWIHQYLSVPSGTPRDRSRIRQFRYMSLQNWHVPVIIGLLPVLMHIALGVFFAGLTVFLCTLNTTIASVIGSIAAAAFGVYITTNLLPLFKPGCPYKTPLTLHSHSLSRYLWHRLEPVIHWFNPPAAPPDPRTYEEYMRLKNGLPSAEPLSLKEFEKERVDSDASNLDVQCLSWLFGASSNSSVQRVILQAVSNLPLQYSGTICDSIPSLKDAITSTMSSIKGKVAERPAYERLFRALSRIEDDFALPRFWLDSEPVDQRLSILADYQNHPVQAAEFLRAEIIKPTTNKDVLSWALIITCALHGGAEWLDVNIDDSLVWRSLFTFLIGGHYCDETTDCDQSREKLVTLAVRAPHCPDKYPLTILDGHGTEKAMSLLYAIQRFMFPSFTKLVLDQYDSSPARFPPDFPSDVALELTLMRSRAVRKVTIVKTELWRHVETLVGLRSPSGHDTIYQHPSIVMPLFNALLDVLCEDDFVKTDTLSIYHKIDICLFLFRTFELQPNLHPHMCPILTPAILQDIIDIAFTPSVMLPSPLVTAMLKFLASSSSPQSGDVYRLLRGRQWLEEIDDLLSSWHLNSGRQHQEYFYNLSFPFLACAYVNGLEALSYVDAPEYGSTLGYLTPSNIFRISRLVLFADADGRKSLQTLANISGDMIWAKCRKSLSAFVGSEAAKATFEYHANKFAGRDPFNCRVRLRYGTYDDLKDLVTETMSHQQHMSGKATGSSLPSPGNPLELSVTNRKSSLRGKALNGPGGTQTETV